MKKICTVFVLALAMGLVLTGCASKNKASKGPKTYRIDLGSAMSTIELGEEENVINVSSLLPEGETPAAGEVVKVMWTFVADEDIGTIYVSCGDNSDDYILAQNIEAGESVYVTKSIPLDLDVVGPLYVTLWSDTESICEVSYIDAK